MKNPCLAVALRELEAAGVRGVEQAHGGKHLQLRWRVNGHDMRIYSMPCTPSDFRSPRNVRADIRRLLREDGVLCNAGAGSITAGTEAGPRDVVGAARRCARTSASAAG